MDLVEEFAAYKIPEYLKKTAAGGCTPFGSLAYTKMMFFVAHVKLTNDDYDKYASIKPERQPDETYEYYKKRQKFQQFLHKWKPHFYDYSVYDKARG